MSAIPRVGLLAALLILSFTPPTATASGCVEVDTSTYGEGLRIIASTGRQIALGVVTGAVGGGIGAVLIITPALCGGVGVGLGNSVTTDPINDLRHSPSYPLLP